VYILHIHIKYSILYKLVKYNSHVIYVIFDVDIYPDIYYTFKSLWAGRVKC
jgi:hypothetical protein